MPDPRFYEDLGPLTVAEVVSLSGARAPGGEAASLPLRLAAPLGAAGADAVSFFADRRYLADLTATAAGACFVAEAFADKVPAGCAALLTSEPQAAWARAATALHRPRSLDPGAPALHPQAELEEGVVLHHGAVVGQGARIGRGSDIGPGAVIGPGVAIGRDCRIGAHAVVGFALIGDRVRVAAGAVIGEAGFGVAVGRSGALDVPQLGRVILQDGVSVGAGTCIDRGAFDDTVVGENTKIDNLVQIAHNVRLGRNCVLAAHVGISGSVTVGDGVMFGGRAGIADHLTIGDGAQIAAASGLMHDVPAGERWGGIPAKPIRRWMRESAWLTKMAQAREGGAEQ